MGAAHTGRGVYGGASTSIGNLKTVVQQVLTEMGKTLQKHREAIRMFPFWLIIKPRG